MAQVYHTSSRVKKGWLLSAALLYAPRLALTYRQYIPAISNIV